MTDTDDVAILSDLSDGYVCVGSLTWKRGGRRRGDINCGVIADDIGMSRILSSTSIYHILAIMKTSASWRYSVEM